MTLFAILAAVMILAALALIVPPLLGRGRGSIETRQELNVVIYRERLAELDADLAEGAIDEAHHLQARAELERDLLEDTADVGREPARKTSAGRWAALAVVVAVPLLAGVLYWQLGAYHLIDGVPEQAADRGPSVESMVQNLAKRLEENPDDLNGWIMLGRSYNVLERYDLAAQAYEKAYTLSPNQPELLADFAEVLSLTAGSSMAGRPIELIKEALRLDPNNIKALWLAGIAAYQAGERNAALTVWQKLAALLPPGDGNGKLVNEAIDRVKSELQGGIASAAAPAPAPVQPVGEAKVVVEVALADALRSQVEPNDTVFIFARANQGPPMPLAAVRLQVKDLPTTVTLDDSQAMMAERRLSSQQQVVISARVSKSGNAIAQPGDLQGSISNVPVTGGEPVKVTIDQQVQ